MYDTFAGFDAFAEFQPRDDHGFVDITQYKTGDRASTFQAGPLKHNEVSEWLLRNV